MIERTHKNGLKVVAEGVETPTQAAYLQKSGCSIMQGYLYYKPLPQTRMVALLTEQATQSIAQ